MVKINGNPEDAAGKCVLDYLNEAGFDADRVVVEINFDIIPKDQYKSVSFKDDDAVEILNFVGGG